ncbi:MAG: hypothetical protein JXA77_12875 [Bacteroidales bacterium]|nr:hypothetical protein [Bacteroidales bacterium]
MKRILLVTIMIFSGLKFGYTQSGGSPLHFAEVINLSESEIRVFINRTRQKIDEFQEFIIILTNKSESRDRRNLAEREALKLFYPGAQIETTLTLENGQEEVTTRLIKEYLYKLKILPYTKVVIEFYDIAYVTTFTKGRDGKYYGTATIFQKFTGFQGDDMVYSSVTKKEIEVILENVEDEFYGEKRWKIFLGDIKASEVKS